MLKKYIMLDKSFSAYNFDIIYNIIRNVHHWNTVIYKFRTAFKKTLKKNCQNTSVFLE